MDTTLFSATILKQAHHHHDHNHYDNHHHHHHHHHFLNNMTNNTTKHIDNMQATTTTTAAAAISGLSSDSAAAAAAEPWGGEKWAPRLLKECARAISEKDSSKIHHLLWMLNELSSPYGDCDQKLASCFLQALFCKATASGRRCHETLASVAEKSRSFDAARRLILKFQEVSPWTTFGHVASNGAILEALDGEANLHIIDMSNTLCTQWPTLLEALATRNDETPRLRLTVVDPTVGGGGAVMKEVGQRMEKFARLMGVPFEFNTVSGQDCSRRLTREGLGIRDGEAVAVNCVGALRRAGTKEREAAVRAFRSLGPKVVTIVEEEADFAPAAAEEGNEEAGGGFAARFEECLRFYTLYFEMLEESFPMTSNEKLMLERECSRGIVRVLACDNDGDGDGDGDGNKGAGEEEEEENYDDIINGGAGGLWDCETREKGKQWCERLRRGFSSVGYSDDVVDDVKALLKRYPSGWGIVLPQQCDSAGIYLTWKDVPVVWASAWKP